MTTPVQFWTDNAVLDPASLAIHTPNDGSQIGGVQPTNHDFINWEVPGRPGAVQITVEGPAWATIMLYTHRPILVPDLACFLFSFDTEILDANEALLETDAMCAVPALSGTGTIMFNESLENMNANGKGGRLQDVRTSGTWLDVTGAHPGILGVGPHSHKIRGAWNRAGNSYGLQTVTIDGVVYTINQNAPGTPSTWAPGINLQWQISCLAAGRTSLVIENASLVQVVR
jgi:hypothetical protein